MASRQIFERVADLGSGKRIRQILLYYFQNMYSPVYHLRDRPGRNPGRLNPILYPGKLDPDTQRGRHPLQTAIDTNDGTFFRGKE